MSYLNDLMALITELEVVEGYTVLKNLLGCSLLCYYLMPLIIAIFLICFLLKSFK